MDSVILSFIANKRSTDSTFFVAFDVTRVEVGGFVYHVGSVLKCEGGKHTLSTISFSDEQFLGKSREYLLTILQASFITQNIVMIGIPEGVEVKYTPEEDEVEDEVEDEEDEVVCIHHTQALHAPSVDVEEHGLLDMPLCDHPDVVDDNGELVDDCDVSVSELDDELDKYFDVHSRFEAACLCVLDEVKADRDTEVLRDCLNEMILIIFDGGVDTRRASIRRHLSLVADALGKEYNNYLTTFQQALA